MKHRIVGVAAGLVVGVALCGGVAQAKSNFKDAFNAKYGTAGTRLDTCKVCHRVVPDLNSYGKAVLAKLGGGLSVRRSLAAIESADSDRDTFSNITEIKALTFPGRKGNHP
jgi:hypothetical protein